MFKPSDSNSDNAPVSIYPFDDEFFAFTDGPVIHRIDPKTLETLKKVDLNNEIGIVSHTAHPHVMDDGTVYNLGLTVSKKGPAYNIICYPPGGKMIENARVVAEIPTRWNFYPSYMHSFGITENFFVIVEQPMTISTPAMMRSRFTKEPMISCFKWFQDELTHIYLVDRASGSLKYEFHCQTFFYFHIINQYETDDYLIIDICSYRDADVMNGMYIESLKNMQSNPDFIKAFRAMPVRFVLPLHSQDKPKTLVSNVKNSLSRCLEGPIDTSTLPNMIKLKESNAVAVLMPDGSIFCEPEILFDIGCEMPQVNSAIQGKEYQYFYSTSCDVDAEHPGKVMKFDILNKTFLSWSEKDCYSSEPIFVPSPEPQSEDDGVILASLVWGKNVTNKVGLLVLDAKTLTELGRCEFANLPSPVPKCLHGWFVKANKF